MRDRAQRPTREGRGGRGGGHIPLTFLRPKEQSLAESGFSAIGKRYQCDRLRLSSPKLCIVHVLVAYFVVVRRRKLLEGGRRSVKCTQKKFRGRIRDVRCYSN